MQYNNKISGVSVISTSTLYKRLSCGSSRTNKTRSKDIKMDPNTYYWHFSKPNKYMLIQKVPEDVTSDWLKLAYECKALLCRDGIDVSEIKLPKFRR